MRQDILYNPNQSSYPVLQAHVGGYLSKVKLNPQMNSPQSPHSRSSRRSYIWDLADNGDMGDMNEPSTSSSLTLDPGLESGRKSGTSSSRVDGIMFQMPGVVLDDDDSATYFSMPSTYNKRHGNTAPLSPNSTLHATVEEIKNKVSVMRAELNSKTKVINELQADLLRIQTARGRREEKIKKNWLNKIKDIQEDHTILMSKQKEFETRLYTDIKSLEEKQTKLLDRCNNLVNGKHQTMDILSDDLRRKKVKVRKQLEADERVHFDKIAASKYEHMKKQAADVFRPKIEKLVVEGKETVRVKNEEYENKLVSLRLQARNDMEKKISQCRSNFLDEMRDEDERIRRLNEKKLQDMLRKHNDEVSGVKDKFARDKKMLEEKNDRVRGQDNEQNLDTLKSLRKNEAKLMEEQLSSQEREITYLLKSHAEELTSLQKSLRDDEEKWEQKCYSWQMQLKGQKHERVKAELHMKAATETEKILQRVREELSEERKKIKADIDNELEDIRLNTQNKLDSMQISESKLNERSKSLRIEIESLRTQISTLQSTTQPSTNELNNQKLRLGDLRVELRRVEDTVDQTIAKGEDDLNRQRKELNTALDQWIQIERDTEEAMSRQDVNIANKKDDLRVNNNAELGKIKDKINALLYKKDNTIKELRRQLSELQSKCTQIQDSIDQRRNI